MFIQTGLTFACSSMRRSTSPWKAWICLTCDHNINTNTNIVLLLLSLVVVVVVAVAVVVAVVVVVVVEDLPLHMELCLGHLHLHAAPQRVVREAADLRLESIVIACCMFMRIRFRCIASTCLCYCMFYV